MTITAEDCLRAIDDIGYVKIPARLDQRQANGLLEAMRRLERERPRPGPDDQPALNRGHAVLYNLQREDITFARVFTGDPLLMEILRGLLNDRWYKQIPKDQPNFILRSLIGRSSGAGTLPLHIDSFIPSSGAFCFSCQIAVVLEDQTRERGCTVVAPRSHRADRYADPSDMADAIPLESKAGDVVIWDSRLWHGALGNQTGDSRWSLIATFVRWWMKQNFDVTGTLPQSIYEQLTDDETAVFGYCSLPPRDEFERTDMKTGHDQLKAAVADYR